jgi:signal transduction histidine kinase
MVFAFTQWEVWVGGPTNLVGPRWAAAASTGIASLLLVGRRSHAIPIQILSGVIVCAPWAVWGASEVASTFVVGVMATYAVGRWSGRPLALLGIPIGAAWALFQIAADPLQDGLGTGWPWAVYAGLAWAAGAWQRQGRELVGRRDAAVASLHRAQLAEQRLGIARDLHDVLANSLGVIVVHAEAAEEVLTSDPQRAAVAMRRIQSTGREALQQVRAVLQPLRAGATDTVVEGTRPRSGEEPSATAKGPGLSDLDAMVDMMRSAGLPVAVRRSGTHAVPDDVGGAVFRVVQEALTNIIRHAGPVASTVWLGVDEEALTVEVSNVGAASGASRPQSPTGCTEGNGLAGIRERVQQLGGTTWIGPRAGGGFAVRARVPLTQSTPSRPPGEHEQRDDDQVRELG